MVLYQLSVPEVFTAIPVLCTLTESPLQSLLECGLEGLLDRESHREE